MIFAAGDWNGWGSLMHTADAVLLFQLIRSLDASTVPERRRRILAKLSSLTFAAYLLSWLPDQVLYPVLNERVPQMVLRLWFYLPVVLASVGISLILAAIVTPAAKALSAQLLRLAEKAASHSRERRLRG